MQPLQRSYAVTTRIENMLSSGSLNTLYDEAKVYELENADKLTDKDQKKLDNFKANKEIYNAVPRLLKMLSQIRNIIPQNLNMWRYPFRY